VEQAKEISERQVSSRAISPPTPEQTVSHTDLFDKRSATPNTLRLGNHTIGGNSALRRISSGFDQVSTRMQNASPVAYHDYSTTTTILATNSYCNWSNFCVSLSADGDLDLIDSKVHRSANPSTFIWQDQYTASCAMNGAWIGPGELALIDKEPRRNRNKTQITVVKYGDPQLSTRPQIIPQRDCPHSLLSKITAIAPLWIKNEKKTFATGGTIPLISFLRTRRQRSFIFVAISE
jgi:hypothetical protein